MGALSARVGAVESGPASSDTSTVGADTVADADAVGASPGRIAIARGVGTTGTSASRAGCSDDTASGCDAESVVVSVCDPAALDATSADVVPPGAAWALVVDAGMSTGALAASTGLAAGARPGGTVDATPGEAVDESMEVAEGGTAPGAPTAAIGRVDPAAGTAGDGAVSVDGDPFETGPVDADTVGGSSDDEDASSAPTEAGAVPGDVAAAVRSARAAACPVASLPETGGIGACPGPAVRCDDASTASARTGTVVASGAVSPVVAVAGSTYSPISTAAEADAPACSGSGCAVAVAIACADTAGEASPAVEKVVAPVDALSGELAAGSTPATPVAVGDVAPSTTSERRTTVGR